MKKILPIIAAALLLASCGDKQPKGNDNPTEKPKKTVAVPQFNADSAYQYVAAQTAFGPRVPETQAHAQCADWLTGKLNAWADTVIVQDFRTRLYNGKGIDGKNIVAVFNPKAKKRIVLCAHWDSRPFADHDDDEANRHTPIDGANDGASGVGVLLECARQFKAQPVHENLGIDIVLFDLEDYGPHHEQVMDYYDDENNYWALGSQHWSKQPHVYGYKAYYGILLDMVGGSGVAQSRRVGLPPVFQQRARRHHQRRSCADEPNRGHPHHRHHRPASRKQQREFRRNMAHGERQHRKHRQNHAWHGWICAAPCAL